MMNIEPGSFLQTKLIVPPLQAGALSRPRLYPALDAALRPGNPVVLVSAPAGSGKTTLLADWLADRKIRAAWVSLDPADSNPARFWGTILQALINACPELGSDLRFLIEPAQPLPVQTMLTALLNRLSQTTAGPVLLVLDDLHLVGSAEVFDTLNGLISRLPPNLHLVLATRYDPPLPLGRLRASGRLVEIRQEDLRINDLEAPTFLNQRTGMTLSAEEIQQLLRRTEGWVAGLILAALSIQKQPDPHAFIRAFTGSHRHIADYLVEEIFNHLAPEQQTFFLQTCILDRFDAALCDGLRGKNDSALFLEEIERANLFLVALDYERRWYRYHHLFADLLRYRLGRVDPLKQPEIGSQTALHCRASACLAEQGLYTEAIQHAIAGGDGPAALRIIEAHGDKQWAKGSMLTLLEWLEEIPAGLLAQSPRALILSAWATLLSGRLNQLPVMRRNLATAGALIQNHPEQGGTLGGDQNLVGMWNAAQASLAAACEEPDLAYEHAQTAARTLPAENLLWRGVAAVALGHVYFLRGEVTNSISAYIEAERINQAAGNDHLQVRSQIYQAMQLTLNGRLQESSRLSRELITRFTADGQATTPMAAGAYWNLANITYCWDDLPGSRDALKEALRLSEILNNVGMREMVFTGQARIAFALGNLAEALDLLEQARTLAVEWQIPTSDLVEIDNLRARIWLALGDENHLQSWISENDPDERVDYATETIRLTLARVWIRRKQPARALAILEKVVQNSVAAGRQLAWFEAKILQAEAFQAGGDPARGQTALGEAIAAAQGEQIRRLFLDEGPQLLPLLRAAARDHPFAAAILDRFPPESLPDKLFTPRYQKQEQVLALKNVLVEPLTLRELEIAHLVAAGLSNPEIASRLCLSINTVKAHLKRIFAKLEAANRAQAIVRCRQLGIG